MLEVASGPKARVSHLKGNLNSDENTCLCRETLRFRSRLKWTEHADVKHDSRKLVVDSGSLKKVLRGQLRGVGHACP